MEKIFYFDCETTGLNPTVNGIHQIALIVEVNGQTKERHDFRLAPFEGDVIEQSALEISGVTTLQIMAYPNPLEVYGKIVKILDKHCEKFNKTDKMYLAGFNNHKFDNEFLRAFFKKCGNNYFGSYFWSNSLDVMCLASVSLLKVRHKMTDFKLKTVSRALGIPVDEDKLHDALYDIDLTRACLLKILGR